MSSFNRATKEKLKLRLALPAPTGGGKTYSALKIARELVGPKGTIAVIDTEHESAKKYADKFEFDHAPLDEFHPDKYIERIREAHGYDCLIIDSGSHEWNGKGGCLELVDYYAKTRTNGNSYAAWNHVTPLHNAFIEACLSFPGHLIICFRSKMDYVQTEGAGGKKKVEKLGMAPVARDGVEYEFDIVMELDQEHTGLITKTRCEALDGKLFRKPGADFVKIVAAWLNSGIEPAPKAEVERRPEPAPAAAPEPEPEPGPEPAAAPAELYGSAPPTGSPTRRVAAEIAEAKAAGVGLDSIPANVIDHPAKAAIEVLNQATTEALDEPWDVILDKATLDEGKWFVRKVKASWNTMLSAADIAAVLKDPNWRQTHHQRSLEAVYGLIKTAIEAEDAEVFGTTREETPA